MTAIFLKEFKAYFSSMLGYIICAFLMAGTGITFTYLCLVNEYAVFGYVISTIGFLLFIIIPILTMRLFADEEKLKTEQLLFSSAISIWDIVIGKYLAAFAVFSLSTLEMCIYPLIIGKYTETSYGMAYTTIFAYWMLGAVLIALGMFISSMTDNSITAAVIGFIVMLVIYAMTMVTGMISTDAYVSLISLIIITIAFFCIIAKLSANKIVPMIVGCVSVLTIGIAFVIKSSAFEGLIITILSGIAFFDKLAYFINGAFDGSAIIYYASFAALFIFLTVKSLQKRRWS